jgi:hypothetical protein
MGIVSKRCTGERNGVYTNNVRRLRMWINWKMESEMFIFNDVAECLHVAIQKTHKLVMMGYINFEDHVLIMVGK